MTDLKQVKVGDQVMVFPSMTVVCVEFVGNGCVYTSAGSFYADTRMSTKYPYHELCIPMDIVRAHWAAHVSAERP